ncbi:S9 family peptidase [Pseudonocardia sp. MH-G8]|uniref:alpha/beta hydrolase family protein n=1 Tax=Pseudonocardia sp. MH-G8 TaxID=1854588 RepID=UPI000BA03DCF|nr:alpha/beta fold hydrolase [Pseudonocardia sp. MH-G8]OZM77537.1 alpha/beta hydrolase [Pseudonocardia sp. MH-G8]
MLTGTRIVPALVASVLALAGCGDAVPAPAAAEPPLRNEDVSYPGDGVELAGTLALPASQRPAPAVLLISGSGPQDRDSALFGHRPFLVMSEALTRAGYAVLRVDDRGVGGSGGVLDKATYGELVADITAGVEFLRARPEVDPAQVGLLGHSEGGVLAPLAAGQTGAAFVVSLAGPAVSGEEVLVAQNRTLFTQLGRLADAEAQVAYVRELTRLLRVGDTDSARVLARREIGRQLELMPPEQRPTPEQIEAQLPVTPYFRSLVLHDPAPSLRALRVPVLAVYGGKDVQVPATQSAPAARELLAAGPDATVCTFPQLNHLMQPAVTGAPAEYASIPTAIDPEVLDLVSGWLATRFATDHGLAPPALPAVCTRA